MIHHSVVRKENKVTIGKEIYYRCPYYHIFASLEPYFKPVPSFLIVEPIEDSFTHIGELKIKFDDKPLAKIGIVRYAGQEIEDKGIMVGDIVQFTKNANYGVKISGEELYRMRFRNIRLVIRDGEIVILKDQVISKGDMVKICF